MDDSNGGANGDTSLYSVRKSVCFKGTGHTKVEHSVFIYSLSCHSKLEFCSSCTFPYSDSPNYLFAIFFNEVFQNHKIALYGKKA